jgi:hypothetical protein
MGLWSWFRPWTATSSQFLSRHHIREDNASRVLEIHQPQSTAETIDVLKNWNRFRWLSEHSIDSQFVEQKILHPLPPGVAQVGGGNPKGALCAEAIRVQFSAIAHQECAIGRF